MISLDATPCLGLSILATHLNFVEYNLLGQIKISVFKPRSVHVQSVHFFSKKLTNE